MKYAISTIVCILLAACIMVLGPRWANAAEKVCAVSSVAEFLDNVKVVTKKVYEVPKDQMDIFVANLNIKRLANKMHAIEADSMLAATLTDGRIGIALFKDGCLVPGMALSGQAEFMFRFLKDMKSEAILNVMAPSA